MAFVAPAGYSPDELEASPRSKSASTFVPTGTLAMPKNTDDTSPQWNAVAGPSGSSAGESSSRRTSKDELPLSPSSAPPNPSVISVTHPPEFIHTHHPRRGSLTPLGLNVISPIPPVQMAYGSTHPPHSPVRSVGFTPTQAHPDAFPTNYPRRGSGASSSSTLTLSRPPQFGSSSSGRDRRRSSLAPTYPAGFNPERRRSSFTPVNPALAPASPTRTHANGVLSRPGSSDGATHHTRHHTVHGPRPLSSVRNQNAAGETRRGSLPQLHYGGWTGPRWNPSLPPQRGSVGEEAGPDQGFKFGSVGDASTAGPSKSTPTSPAAQRPIEISSSRRSSKVRMDAFQEAEAAEAERQRRAFLAATYGEDGRRARERLSIGGPQAHAPTPSSPSNRRPSLMLWEKLGMAAAAKVVEPEIAASSAPSLMLPKSLSDDNVGPRRGSLPIAIPLASSSVSPGSRRDRQLGASPRDPYVDDFGGEDVDEERERFGAGERYDSYDPDRLAPTRPAPPLLPLSDPGPRLLPSTLALQRASHLLNSRNLQADPLPHPLPPSLHPPIPVDVTEFDIDFILAGSQSQLGRSKRASNATNNAAPLDVIAPFAASAPTPTLKLGGDDEDSFAKFVGKFDDEYGGRRGEWTFRAKTSGSEADARRTVWESPGAGAFELFPNGDVRCARSGTTWRITRKGLCEFEIESVSRGSGFFDRLIPPTASNERYVAATKALHCEHGGIRAAANTSTTFDIPSASASSRPSLERPRPMKERLRVSISEATRTMRLDSTDSSATAKMSSSLPSAVTPKKKRRGSKEGEGLRMDSLPKLLRVKSRDEREKDKDKDKDRDGDDKKSSSFFKRGLMAPFKNTSFVAQYEEKKAQREERERERQQAHSWAGSSSHSGFIHPSGKNTPPAANNSPNPERSASVQTSATVASSVRTSSSDEPLNKFVSLQAATPLESDGDLREGKAWAEVPEDAVAMVLPSDAGEVEHPTETLASPTASTTSVDPRQALLVWYVPFNGESDNRGSSTTTPRPALQSSTSTDSATPTPSSPSSSLPKFQKLLRRRTSKDKELTRNSSQRSSDVEQSYQARPPKHPLPFRSFRVVARIVDIDDLRSTSSASQDSPSDPPAASVSAPPTRPTALSVDSATNLKPKLTSNKTDDTASSSYVSTGSTAPTSTILAGRTISTVIAVCHSRTQGVEFVLEGLDRLGYCTGESAWGPTGYEEWRGTGLSERGRELLELLWAGCTGVMGLTANTGS